MRSKQEKVGLQELGVLEVETVGDLRSCWEGIRLTGTNLITKPVADRPRAGPTGAPTFPSD